MNKAHQKEGYLYLFAIIASVLLSFINIIGHPVFNSDGVFYFQVAETYLEHGFHAARLLFDWPFYPISVAWLSQALGLSLIHAAYLMNIVYSALISVTFARLIRHLDRRFIFQCFSVVLILLWHTFSKQRFTFTRDQGFFLFALLSLLAFFNHVEKRHILWAFLWFLCIAIAGLYRVEGMVVLLVAPLSVLCLKGTWHERLMSYIKLNLLTVVAVLLLLVFGHHYLIQAVWEKVHGVIHGHAATGRSLFHFPRLVFAYVVKLLGSIPLVYWLLFIFAFVELKREPALKLRLLVSFEKIKVLFGYVLPCFLITFAFYYSEHFLESRYLLLFLSLFLLLTPFGFYNLYKSWRSRQKLLSLKGLLFPLIILLLIAEFIADIYPFGTSHRYVMQAAQWVKKNVPAQTMLYTCKGRLAILADRAATTQSSGWRIGDPYKDRCGQVIEFPGLNKYNGQAQWAIYGVDVRGDSSNIKRKLRRHFSAPIKQFENRHHDAVLLYKVVKEK